MGIIYAVKVSVGRFAIENLTEWFPVSCQSSIKKGSRIPLKSLSVTNSVFNALGFMCVTCPVPLQFSHQNVDLSTGRSTNARK